MAITKQSTNVVIGTVASKFLRIMKPKALLFH